MRFLLPKVRRWFHVKLEFVWNQKEIHRLRRERHPLAAVLADSFAEWQARQPLDDRRIERVELQRQKWLELPDDSPENAVFDDKHTVARACRASKPQVWAELIYRLVRTAKPAFILELGTNLGISSAYLAVAGRKNNATVTTLDAAASRMALARELHGQLSLTNVAYRLGRFNDTLPEVLKECPDIGFAFIDGHHHYKPTLDYFNMIYPRLVDGALVVFDDIYWSRGMMDAWEELSRDPRFAFTIDLITVGIGVIRRPAVGKPPVFRLGSLSERSRLRRRLKSS